MARALQATPSLTPALREPSSRLPPSLPNHYLNVEPSSCPWPSTCYQTTPYSPHTLPPTSRSPAFTLLSPWPLYRETSCDRRPPSSLVTSLWPASLAARPGLCSATLTRQESRPATTPGYWSQASRR